MTNAAYIPLLAVAMFALVVAAVRIAGLRSFSKMSSFDFAVTVSIGSILVAVATASTSLLNGALAAGSLLSVQVAVSWIRARRPRLEQVLDNTPLLLMDGPGFLEHNLNTARVARTVSVRTV